MDAFKAALSEKKDFNKRMEHMQIIVQSVRYNLIPEEGLQNVLADFIQAWDKTAGFSKMDELTVGSQNGDDQEPEMPNPYESKEEEEEEVTKNKFTSQRFSRSFINDE